MIDTCEQFSIGVNEEGLKDGARNREGDYWRMTYVIHSMLTYMAYTIVVALRDGESR